MKLLRIVMVSAVLFSYLNMRAVHAEESQVPDHVLKQFERLVGEWTAEGTTREGKPAEMKVTVEWAPGKHMLVFHAEWSEPGLKSRGSGVFGWDAAENQVHASEFWNNNVYHHRHFKIEGDRWRGMEFAGADREGKEIKGKAVMQFAPDGKSWTFEMSDVVVGGEPQERGAELKFTRKP